MQFFKYVSILLVATGFTACAPNNFHQSIAGGGSHAGGRRLVSAATTRTESQPKAERFDGYGPAIAATQGKHELVFYPCITGEMRPDKGIPLTAGEVADFFASKVPEDVLQGITPKGQRDSKGRLGMGYTQAQAERMVRYCGGVWAEWKEVQTVDVPAVYADAGGEEGGGGRNIIKDSGNRYLKISLFEGASAHASFNGRPVGYSGGGGIRRQVHCEQKPYHQGYKSRGNGYIRSQREVMEDHRRYARPQKKMKRSAPQPREAQYRGPNVVFRNVNNNLDDNYNGNFNGSGVRHWSEVQGRRR